MQDCGAIPFSGKYWMPTAIGGRPLAPAAFGSLTKLVTACCAAPHQVVGGFEFGSGSPIDEDWSNMMYMSTGAGSALNAWPPQTCWMPPAPVAVLLPAPLALQLEKHMTGPEAADP